MNTRTSHAVLMNEIEENLDYIRMQVAERLGWSSFEYSSHGFLVGFAPGYRKLAAVPSFARDIGAAWIVVDYLRVHGIRTTIQCSLAGGARQIYSAAMEYRGAILSHTNAPTAALAISKAFLQVPGDRLTCPYGAAALERRNVSDEGTILYPLRRMA